MFDPQSHDETAAHERRARRSPADKHRRAVMNTLSWADECAAQGDYVNAIAWLDTITAIGDELPRPYRAKRAMWQNALRPLARPA